LAWAISKPALAPSKGCLSLLEGEGKKKKKKIEIFKQQNLKGGGQK